LRSAITVLAIAIGLAFVVSVFVKGGREASQRAATVNDTSTPQQLPTSTNPHSLSDEPGATALSAPIETTTSSTPVTPIDGLHPVPAKQAQVSTVGATDPDGRYMLQAELTGWGAGVRYIRLSRYTMDWNDDTPYVVQQPLEAVSANNQTTRLYPFAARAITVNGTRISLESVRWELGEPGVYRLLLADAQDRPVLRITRRYSVKDDQASYDLRCEQSIENLATTPLRVVWEQYAQGDTPNDGPAYMGDRRLVVAGYYDLGYDPSRQFVYTKGSYLARRKVLNGDPIWHGNEDIPADSELVWFATVNRYFTTATHPVVEATTPPPDHPVIAPLDRVFERLGTRVIGQPGSRKNDPRVMAFTLTSKPIDIPTGNKTRLDLSLYAGPRDTKVFAKEPYSYLGFAKLVVYELGCAIFTFQPLAKGLLAFLRGIHFVIRDWGVAIVFLVLCVRLALHPITKRAQVNMFKMSKQMQSMQPEIEKLKKKYKDDQQKFQQEQLKLWREKGVNPVNMLGCLPMFLQTPIWVALYAMLYLAIELRHQPAFYGLFQSLTNGHWHFLSDLSSPDNFIKFAGDGFTLNLLFVHPKFAGINLLPLLMAVVFYFQQKLTTPPPANEQAAQQQKIMKYMVFLFPIFLYSAPSGLTLYILASTFAGIIDSYIVRKHVKEQEEAGELFKPNKKPIKPGGFMDRMHKALEAKQREMANQKKKPSGKSAKRRK